MLHGREGWRGSTEGGSRNSDKHLGLSVGPGARVGLERYTIYDGSECVTLECEQCSNIYRLGRRWVLLSSKHLVASVHLKANTSLPRTLMTSGPLTYGPSVFPCVVGIQQAVNELHGALCRFISCGRDDGRAVEWKEENQYIQRFQRHNVGV